MKTETGKKELIKEVRYEQVNVYQKEYGDRKI